jgi:hypothetical protein
MTLAHTAYTDIPATHTIDATVSTTTSKTVIGGTLPIASDGDITAVTNYQDELQTTVATRESINRDINAQLNYTIMAMTIWVPLGIFAGYYLYSRGSSSA